MRLRRWAARPAFGAIAFEMLIQAGCHDTPTDPRILTPSPAPLISDAVYSGGRPHFYVLPPKDAIGSRPELGS